MEQAPKYTASDHLVRMVNDIASRMTREDWGWKARLAKCFGVSGSYITKVLSESPPNLSAETGEKIARRIGLAPSYFTPGDHENHWEDYLEDPPPTRDLVRDIDYKLATFATLSKHVVPDPHARESDLMHHSRSMRELADALGQLPVVKLAQSLEAARQHDDGWWGLSRDERYTIRELVGESREGVFRPLVVAFAEEQRIAFRELVRIHS